MANPPIERPQSGEFAEFYAKYIALVPDGDLIASLRNQQRDTSRMLRGAADHADQAYAPGKWTVKEVVGHLADAERVFVYRAMRFARADATPLQGFDENTYVANANFGTRSLDSLVDEYSAVRQATIAFAASVTPEEAARQGDANGKAISVRALLHIVAGHELHHSAILRERYGL